MTDRSSKSVADFLQRSLAGGALGVRELEVRARAAGLLGERQQIQHAKAFKKAKKALGIRSIRAGFGSGGKWAWLMPPQDARVEVGSVAMEDAPEDDTVAKARVMQEDKVASSDRDTKEQHSVRDAKHLVKRPAETDSRGIVQRWIDGVQSLDYARSPTAVPLIRWQQFLGDCHRFLSSPENWAERAATLGWNALGLFGCHRGRPLEHLGSAGLLWFINGGNLVELHRDWAVIERQHDKSRQVYHRRRQDDAHVTLPWIGLRAKGGTP